MIFAGRLGGQKVELTYVKGTKKYDVLAYESLGKRVEFYLTKPNKYLLVGTRYDREERDVRRMLEELDYMMRRVDNGLRGFDGSREETVADRVNALVFGGKVEAKESVAQESEDMKADVVAGEVLDDRGYESVFHAFEDGKLGAVDALGAVEGMLDVVRGQLKEGVSDGVRGRLELKEAMLLRLMECVEGRRELQEVRVAKAAAVGVIGRGNVGEASDAEVDAAYVALDELGKREAVLKGEGRAVLDAYGAAKRAFWGAMVERPWVKGAAAKEVKEGEESVAEEESAVKERSVKEWVEYKFSGVLDRLTKFIFGEGGDAKEQLGVLANEFEQWFDSFRDTDEYKEAKRSVYKGKEDNAAIIRFSKFARNHFEAYWRGVAEREGVEDWLRTFANVCMKQAPNFIAWGVQNITWQNLWKRIKGDVWLDVGAAKEAKEGKDSAVKEESAAEGEKGAVAAWREAVLEGKGDLRAGIAALEGEDERVRANNAVDGRFFVYPVATKKGVKYGMGGVSNDAASAPKVKPKEGEGYDSFGDGIFDSVDAALRDAVLARERWEAVVEYERVERERKEAEEARVRSEAEAFAASRLGHYVEGKTKLQAGRLRKFFSQRFRLPDGGWGTRAEMVEAFADGAYRVDEQMIQGKTEYVVHKTSVAEEGSIFPTLTKTDYAYFKWLRGEGADVKGADGGKRYRRGGAFDAEYAEIERRAKADGSWLKAPNGAPSRLSERQWVQVRSKAFKEWFGDWENDAAGSSKVVDENGEPLVVYHVTSEEFNTFDLSKARSNMEVQGFFFSSGVNDWADMGERTMGVFLNMRHPSSKPIVDRSVNDGGVKARLDMLDKGVDGAIESDEEMDEVEYMVLNANQIKSADGNVGAFDAGNADVRFRRGGVSDFKGRLERAIAEKGSVAPNLSDREFAVVDVPKHPFKGGGKSVMKQAKKWAAENLVKEYVAHEGSPDAFSYILSKKALNKYFSASATHKSSNLGVHIAALMRLPEIIDSSVETEEHADYIKADGARRVSNGINRDVIIHRLYGAVRIDGKIYRVKTTIKEVSDEGKDSAYSYEVQKIELLEGVRSTTANAPAKPVEMHQSNSIKGSTLLKDVEKSYDKGKKLLDESENGLSTFMETKVEKENETTKRRGEKNKEFDNGALRGGERVDMVALREGADELASRLHCGVRYVERLEDLDARDRGAKGWYDVGRDEVVVVLPNAEGRADVEATIWHEVVGHKGVREVVGDERFDAFLEAVYRGASGDVRSEIDGKARDYARADGGVAKDYRLEAVEEYIAEMAEGGVYDEVNGSFWSMVKRLFVEMYRKLRLRFSGRLSDADVRFMLVRSKRLREGGGKNAVFDAADRVGLRNRFEREERENENRYRFIGERGAGRLDAAWGMSANLDGILDAGVGRSELLDGLRLAQEMEGAGKDASAVKYATGWERGGDGKWRYETMDLKVSRDASEWWEVGHSAALANWVDDYVLFGAYPELRGVDVVFADLGADVGGHYDRVRNKIAINSNYMDYKRLPWMEQKRAKGKLKELDQRVDELLDNIVDIDETDAALDAVFEEQERVKKDAVNEFFRSVLSHEIQHAIQDIEGFEGGASPEDVRNRVEGRVNAEGVSDAERVRMKGLLEEMGDEGLYRRVGGEVEARNVQGRLGMSADERRGSLAVDTEDVGRDEQIYLGNGGGGVSYSLDAKGKGLFKYFKGGLLDFVSQAKSLKKGFIKIVVAPFSGRLQNDLREKGLDLSSDYKHVMDNSAVLHVLNRHSSANEYLQGQVPITENDFLRASDVLENYDNVRIEDASQGQKIIIYSKTYSDGTTIYVEETRNKRKELALKSMWKKKSPTLTDAKQTNLPPISDLGRTSDDKGKKEDSNKQIINEKKRYRRVGVGEVVDRSVEAEEREAEFLSRYDADGKLKGVYSREVFDMKVKDSDGNWVSMEDYLAGEAAAGAHLEAIKGADRTWYVLRGVDGVARELSARQADYASFVGVPLEVEMSEVDAKDMEREELATSDRLNFAPDNLETAINDGLLLLASRNAEHYRYLSDVVRNNNKVLNGVVARAQRGYDEWCARELYRLGKMYVRHGVVDGVRRHELVRAMSLVRQSVGKKDLGVVARQLLGLLNRVQAESLEGRIDKLMKRSGRKKKNGGGVRVMGGLDVLGAARFGAFKDWRNRSVDDIEAREGELYGRLAVEELGDAEVMDIEGELDGLYLARLMSLVRQSRENGVGLKKELAAHRKAVGGDVGRRDELREMSDGVADALLEMGVDEVEKLGEVLGALSAYEGEGRAGARAFREGKKERRSYVNKCVNYDLKGVSREWSPEESMGQRLLNNPVFGVLFSTMGSMEMYAKLFGRRSVDGKGYLYGLLVNDWLDARSEELRNRAKDVEVIKGKIDELFGGVERFGGLKDMGGLQRYLGEQAPIMVRVWTGEYDGNGEAVYGDMELPQGIALYVYMVNKMSDGKVKLAKMGLTEDVVSRLSGELDAEVLAFADWENLHAKTC